jgi:hypothetical protein
MAYVDSGYSAFEHSDEFLHPETGCVLTLQYGQANVRHYQGSTFQDTRPVLRKPEDLLYTVAKEDNGVDDEYDDDGGDSGNRRSRARRTSKTSKTRNLGQATH